MNKLDLDYQNLLKDILENGTKKETRNGGTISVFGRQIRHKMSDGFPLLTTKKMAFKTMVTELLWFLRGDTNIKYLVDNDCHIWDGDAYKNYSKTSIDHITFSERNKHFKTNGLEFNSGYPNYIHFTQEEFINKIKTDDEFAKKWGELGPIYGKQWRKWDVPRIEPKGFNFDKAWEKSQELWKSSNGMECGPSFETFCMSLLRSKKMGIAYGYHTQIDQIQNLIRDLKTNPDSRRLMVSAWNVGELDQCVLPPCHYGFQVYTRELSEKERITLAGYDYENRGGIGWNMIKEEVDLDISIPRRAISLMWNQRSVDTFLGLPFNIASYGLLLEIIAKEVNMVPDELIGNLGDVHLYSNHVEQAKEQIGREITEEEILEHLQQSGMDAANYEYRMEYVSKLPKRTRQPYPLPTLKIEDEVKWKEGDCLPSYSITDFTLENYQSHPTIKAPLSN